MKNLSRAALTLTLFSCACSAESGGAFAPAASSGAPGVAVGGASSATSGASSVSAGTSGVLTVGTGSASSVGSGGSGASAGGVSDGGARNVASGGASGVDDQPAPLGASMYEQNFGALAPGLWKKNLDTSKLKAHPENAQIAASCGPDGSNCLRIVYRQSDGIHKQPASDPVFTGSDSSIDWAPSDTDHTNTATDVTQANIAIDGSTDGKSSASATAKPAKAYTLTYDLYFEPGFDFAKGGKLPGLAAAAFDSGCTEDGSTKRQPTNWSERVMWRANGRLQLYSYDQSRPSGSCGVERTIDEVAGDPEFEQPGVIPQDDKFRLQPGTWYTVRLSVRVNDNDSVTYLQNADGSYQLDADGFKQPLTGNGAVNLAIEAKDGSVKRQLVFSNVALRDECDGDCGSQVPDSQAAWANALFFSTFFGGNETKRLTCIDTAKSTLTSLVEAKMPSYPGLTQSAFDALCASQINPAIYPVLTWNPQTVSAARFDNFLVQQGYTGGGF